MKLTVHAGAGLAVLLLLAACGGVGEGAASDTTETPASAVQTVSAGNPLISWCMETETQEACECADPVLRAASTEKDYEIYQSLAPSYLERRAAGDDYVTAFDTASAQAAKRLDMTAGELRSITNRMGRQHRDAIEQCDD